MHQLIQFSSVILVVTYCRILFTQFSNITFCLPYFINNGSSVLASIMILSIAFFLNIPTCSRFAGGFLHYNVFLFQWRVLATKHFFLPNILHIFIRSEKHFPFCLVDQQVFEVSPFCLIFSPSIFCSILFIFSAFKIGYFFFYVRCPFKMWAVMVITNLSSVALSNVENICCHLCNIYISGHRYDSA